MRYKIRFKNSDGKLLNSEVVVANSQQLCSVLPVLLDCGFWELIDVLPLSE